MNKTIRTIALIILSLVLCVSVIACTNSDPETKPGESVVDTEDLETTKDPIQSETTGNVEDPEETGDIDQPGVTEEPLDPDSTLNAEQQGNLDQVPSQGWNGIVTNP